MRWAILSDPAGHDSFTGYSRIPTITVAVNGGSNTITGPSPWVMVSGSYNSSTGAFTDSGTGTVAGLSNVPVSVTGTLSGNSITFSQLQLGPANLPTNRAEVLSGTGANQ